MVVRKIKFSLTSAMNEMGKAEMMLAIVINE